MSELYPHEQSIVRIDVIKYYVLAKLFDTPWGVLRILRYHQLYEISYSDVLPAEGVLIEDDQFFLEAVAPICHARSNLVWTLTQNFITQAKRDFSVLVSMYSEECATLRKKWSDIMEE